jgi:SAM-dependent methyltransferase
MIGRLVRAAGRHVLAPLAPLARTACVLLDAAGWRYTVPGERSTCPACDAADLEHLHPLPLHDRPAGRRVGFVTGCRRCGIVFANPMPSDEALARMYSPEGRWGRTHADDRHEGRSSSRYLVKLFSRVQPGFDIAHPAPGSAVLDFGCGSGEILDVLQDLGWTTYGIEPAAKQAFVRHRELRDIPSSAMFDLAVAHHVLEHVGDPLRILRALLACLKPGGLLFVSVPRLDTLAQHGDYHYCINDRAHIVSYTTEAMAALMGMAGFEAIPLNPPPGEATHGWRAVKRLVMIGRKGGTPTTVAEPLRAARNAFDAFATSGGSDRARPSPAASVRAAAAAMNMVRERDRKKERAE